MSSGVKREDDSIRLSIACHQGIEAVSGTKLIGNCFRPFSELFSAVIDDIRPNALIQCPTALPESGSRKGLPPFFGNHPFSNGFLRRIFSPTIRPIPTMEKDKGKPSSRFLHIMQTVCTSYAAVCSPYALFRLKQKANEE